jgi:opacity protein-like surface antigen
MRASNRSVVVAVLGMITCTLFCAATPAIAAAQRSLHLGVAGGVSVPSGTLRDGVNTGWHALGTIALSSPMQPLGLRLDGAYNRFAFSDQAGTALRGDGNQTVSSATLNASYRLPMTNSPLSPYVIAGLGAYRTACSLSPGCDASTRFGWNAGLGTKLYLRGVTSFLEARYHQTSRGESGVHFVPVTFGLLF